MQEQLDNELAVTGGKLRFSAGQTCGGQPITTGGTRGSGNSTGAVGNGGSVVKRATASYDIFENLNKDEYKRARKLMITCILGTDMS
jgi:hypothetical protein